MSPDRLEAVKEYEKTYYRENREKILEQRKAQYWANHDKKRSRRRVVCSTLKRHKEALADDPERLSTDFILELVQGES